MGFDRRWTDDPSSDDACGRAIFGIGVAAAIAPWTHIGREARRLFELVAPFRSVYPRATAHAVVGAAELTVADAACVSARSLVEDGLASLPRGTDDARWPWPEPRLAYGNALLPEALIAGGHAIGDDDVVDEGLRLLRWLVAEETLGDHFSFSPAAGRGPDDARPAFDQQPIEAGALADACARAFAVTHDDSLARAAPLVRRMVRRGERRGGRDVRSGDGRGLRRAGGGRGQSEPGRRVDDRVRLHDAARADVGAVARRFSERRGARPAADPPGPSRRRRTGPPLRT